MEKGNEEIAQRDGKGIEENEREYSYVLSSAILCYSYHQPHTYLEDSECVLEVASVEYWKF